MFPMPWESLLLSWLHDPLDKAADIGGHEARARRYAAIVLGREVTEAELKGGWPDHIASAYERLPMPPGDREETRVGPEDGQLTVIHPLSAEAARIRAVLDEGEAESWLRRTLPEGLSPKQRFLTLWRHAPEKFGLRLPAETRNPDHTLWQHLDATSALALCGGGRIALLSFKMSPVQPFIEASRSLRDLLSGSYLLSWICFSAMEPVLEACGPTAVVYPSLRGTPLMDWWLRKQGVKVEIREEELTRASVPNRFLAIVPQPAAAELADAVRQAAEAGWTAVANTVRESLKRDYEAEFPGWDRLWEAQTGSYFDFRTTWLAPADANYSDLFGADVVKDTSRVAGLAEPGYTAGATPGQWQRSVMVSAALMEAATRIRHIPEYAPSGEVPQKCTLLGTYEQIGPARLSESRKFWEQEEPERADRDRRCAVMVVKKHAFARFFRRRVGVDLDEVRFPDTEELAGDGRRYFAILAMDGDDMGQWLSGAKSPRVEEVLHPKIVRYQEGCGRREALEARRPVSPSLHAAISEALTRFAVRIAPGIVEEHRGRLIYSGGDDVVAALPVDTVLNCAGKLREAFRSPEVMGSRAGISAGIAVGHVEEDLRYVVQSARRAEGQSKERGKDRLTLAILRRSGEHAAATCGWDYVPTLVLQTTSFENHSDRWTYQLRRQLGVLKGLPAQAFAAELRRLLHHSEKADRRFAADFEEFLRRHGETGRDRREEFVILCQSASFLARGRD
jgi:CRISPR-associated protein Cmr2